MGIGRFFKKVEKKIEHIPQSIKRDVKIVDKNIHRGEHFLNKNINRGEHFLKNNINKGEHIVNKEVNKGVNYLKKNYKNLGKQAAEFVVSGVGGLLQNTPIGFLTAPITDTFVQDIQNGNMKATKKMVTHPVKYLQRAVKDYAENELSNVQQDLMGGAEYGSTAIMPITNALSKDLQTGNMKFSNLKDTFKSPQKYLQQVGWDTLTNPLAEYIPGSQNLQKSIGDSIIHGNTKYINNELPNVTNEIINGVMNNIGND